eukprot:UN10673
MELNDHRSKSPHTIVSRGYIGSLPHILKMNEFFHDF